MDRIIVILYFALVLTSACTKSQSNAFKLDSASAQSIDFETTKQIIQANLLLDRQGKQTAYKYSQRFY